MSRRRTTTKHRNSSPAGTVAAVSAAAASVLCFAVAMLGHATRSGTTQWAEGAFTASVIALSGAVFIALVSTAFAIQDARDQRQIEAAVAQMYGH